MSTPPTAALTRAQVLSWRNAIFIIFMLPGIAMASWASRLPAIRDAIDLGPGQVGLLIVGISIGSIVSLVASSHVVARFGAVATITGGLLLTAVGLVVAGIGATVAPSFAVTFAGLLIFGLSTGVVDVAMNVSGAANERALGRAIMPIFHAFFSFGTILGAGFGALAERIHLPIAIHLSIAAAIIVVTILAARRFVESEHVIEEDGQPVPDDHHSKTWQGRLSIWKDPRTLLIGLLVLGAAFAEGSANDWVSIASVDGHGLTREQGALVLGLFLTAMTAGRLGGVLLLDRFGRVPVLRGSFLLAAVGLVIFIFVPVTPIAMVGVALWGLGSALGFPIGMSAAADDPKTAAARVSAVATIGYFAFLVGPPVIGLLGEHTGVLHALLIVLVLAAIGAFVAGAAREPQRAAQP